MENAFEDIKREYVNSFRESKGILFAHDYDEFVSKLLFCIQTALNTTDIGQRVIDEMLGSAWRNNISKEEWQQRKVNLMKLLFIVVLDECKPMKHEFAHHLYTSLRKEEI